MKKGRTMLAVVGLAALTAAGPAVAQDTGLYLGGSFGTAEFADTCTNLNLASGCRDHDEAWRAFGGYRFSRYLALELGFADLGTVSASGDLGTGLITEELQTRAFDLVAVVTVPIVNRLSGFGKLGMYRAKTSHEVVSGQGTAQSHDQGSGITYGAGLGLDLGSLGLRLEWQRWDNVGGSTTLEETIDFFSIGALIRF
ncbi:MAG: outer membrane beta-barrel protein [Burkholderiales bacterium]